MLRYSRCNIVTVMAATAWLMSFSYCIVCGFDSYTVLVKCPQRKFLPPPRRRGRGEKFWRWGEWGEIFSGDTWQVRYRNQTRTRYSNWRTTSATQLQPSQSLCYIRYTSTRWRHDCSLTVQTLCAIYILTSERVSQGHVRNGRRAAFSWHILYNPWLYVSLIRCGDKIDVYK
jgi:hypothetical protein